MAKASAPEADKTPKSKQTLWWLIVALAAATLLLEFSLDLNHEPWWYSVAIGFDLLLVLGFFVHLVQRALLARFRFWRWVMQDKGDIILMALVLPALFVPRFAAGLIVARVGMQAISDLLDTDYGRRMVSNIKLKPSQTLALSFVGVIVVATLLLMFPAATLDGQGASLLTALFTSTSAVCVVGLSVLDIGTYFTHFGQVVILGAIQVGGLGIMVLSAAFAILVGGHLPSRRQSGLSEILDISTPEGLRTLIKAVAASTFIFELLGAIGLFIGFADVHLTLTERIWWAIFHSVAAFCNAGFSLAPDSLHLFVDNPMVCLIFILLITVGGIGFFVIADLSQPRVWEIKKPLAIWQRLQVQTKVVLVASLMLNIIGMLTFLYLEYDGVMRHLSVGEKIMAALFQAVSLRTAGFEVVPMWGVAPATVMFCVAWMFIGASPGSTGGGIKTTTAAIAVMALRSMLLSRDDVELFGRRVPAEIVNRSLSIILTALVVVFGFLILLLATQALPVDRLTFEVASAFGTVGLSMNLTAQLDSLGRLLIIVLMFIGRIGPLTMALAIGERVARQNYRLPEGRVAVG